MEDLGNTTTATTNRKHIYSLRSLTRFRELDSSFTVTSSSLDAVDEEENYNRSQVSTYVRLG